MWIRLSKNPKTTVPKKAHIKHQEKGVGAKNEADVAGVQGGNSLENEETDPEQRYLSNIA